MIHTQKEKVVLVTSPAAIVDNAAVTTASIDTNGFDYAKILVILGATDIAVAALKLRQSDNDSDYSDVEGGDFATDGTLPSATDDNKVFAFNVDMLGKKRYLDVTLTGGDGTAGAYFTVVALLSKGKTGPSDAASRGVAGELFV
jgi:hypothetical protein